MRTTFIQRMKQTAAAFGVGLVLAASGAAFAQSNDVVVYKSPMCGCCAKWVDHLRSNGFKVTVHDSNDMNKVKTERKVPSDLASCHTAVVGGYTIEGHVPAASIKKLLQTKPKVAGISVPGMPMGSPGMEGDRQDHYQVVAFDAVGKRYVFQQY